MRLTVVAHKEVWRDAASPSGFVTHGGFPLQMQAISEAFDDTVVAVFRGRSRSLGRPVLPATGA